MPARRNPEYFTRVCNATRSFSRGLQSRRLSGGCPARFRSFPTGRIGVGFMNTAILCALILPTVATPTGQGTDYSADGARVVGDLAAGRFGQVTARFDARLAKDLPADKLSALWGQMT